MKTIDCRVGALAVKCTWTYDPQEPSFIALKFSAGGQESTWDVSRELLFKAIWGESPEVVGDIAAKTDGTTLTVTFRAGSDESVVEFHHDDIAVMVAQTLSWVTREEEEVFLAAAIDYALSHLLR